MLLFLLLFHSRSEGQKCSSNSSHTLLTASISWLFLYQLSCFLFLKFISYLSMYTATTLSFSFPPTQAKVLYSSLQRHSSVVTAVPLQAPFSLNSLSWWTWLNRTVCTCSAWVLHRRVGYLLFSPHSIHHAPDLSPCGIGSSKIFYNPCGFLIITLSTIIFI